MSMVTKEEIRALSRLARLTLTDAEVDSLQDDLSGILEHMSVLSEVDTEGVTPMCHVSASDPGLRPDIVEPGLDRERVLAAAYRVEEGCFAVPSILPSGDES